jgi:hypothetical protein
MSIRECSTAESSSVAWACSIKRRRKLGELVEEQDTVVPEGSRMYLEAGEPNEGNPGARQPSSASVCSTFNPSRNSLAARLDPSA